MEEKLAQEAIKFALVGNYQNAIKLNLQILKSDSENIDALNRLARAYFESGMVSKAKKISLKVIKLDPNNNIAKNSLEKYSSSQPHSKQQRPKDVSTFIEEPGRTKLTTLINLGSDDVISSLSAGDEVSLLVYAHKVSVVTMEKEYIGKLADDLSARVRQIISKGCKYSVVIKSASKKCVKIFIKTNTISFPVDASESFSELSS